MANCFCMRLTPERVKVLDFRHSSLTFMPAEVLEFEETLEELYLDSNDIRDLPRSLFHFEWLKKLGASDNQLSTVPKAIGNLLNLEELDISKNEITSVSNTIRGCKKLKLLEISVNPLGRLPEDFTQLYNLSELYLNDTLLDFLPATFGRLIQLKVLELRENNMKMLPLSIERLINLERLDLGQNQFRDLPDVIGSLTSLRELWLDANKICHLPETIGNLRNLFYVDASRNRLEYLPDTISEWGSIEQIQLSKNFLQKLPQSIGKLRSLRILQADNNQLCSLPYSIGGLQSLQELIIYANDIEELPSSIGLLRKLKHLNVDDNMLVTVPSTLGSCSNISLLFLRGNYLETIPDEIGRITNLTVANFSNNKLKNLPYSFTKLKNLQALWLSENQAKPLMSYQSEICEETGKRVLTCFLLPQQPMSETEYDERYSDDESFHMSAYNQKLKERAVVAFDVAESETKSEYHPMPKTPYPKERFRLRFKGSPAGNCYAPSEVSDFVPPQPRRSPTKSPQCAVAHVDAQSGRMMGRREMVAKSGLQLFKADKEKKNKDKARLKRSALSDGEDAEDGDETSTVLKGPKKMAVKNELRASSDTEVLPSGFDETDREVADLTTRFRRNLLPESKFSNEDLSHVVFTPEVSHVIKKRGPLHASLQQKNQAPPRHERISQDNPIVKHIGPSAPDQLHYRQNVYHSQRDAAELSKEHVQSTNNAHTRITPVGAQTLGQERVDTNISRSLPYGTSNTPNGPGKNTQSRTNVNRPTVRPSSYRTNDTQRNPQNTIGNSKPRSGSVLPGTSTTTPVKPYSSNSWSSSQRTPSISYQGSNPSDRTRRQLNFSGETRSPLDVSQLSQAKDHGEACIKERIGIDNYYETISDPNAPRRRIPLDPPPYKRRLGLEPANKTKQEKPTFQERPVDVPVYQERAVDVPLYHTQGTERVGQTTNHPSGEDVRWGLPQNVLGDKESLDVYIIEEERTGMEKSSKVETERLWRNPNVQRPQNKGRTIQGIYNQGLSDQNSLPGKFKSSSQSLNPEVRNSQTLDRKLKHSQNPNLEFSNDRNLNLEIHHSRISDSKFKESSDFTNREQERQKLEDNHLGSRSKRQMNFTGPSTKTEGPLERGPVKQGISARSSHPSHDSLRPDTRPASNSNYASSKHAYDQSSPRLPVYNEVKKKISGAPGTQTAQLKPKVTNSESSGDNRTWRYKHDNDFGYHSSYQNEIERSGGFHRGNGDQGEPQYIQRRNFDTRQNINTSIQPSKPNEMRFQGNFLSGENDMRISPGRNPYEKVDSKGDGRVLRGTWRQDLVDGKVLSSSMQRTLVSGVNGYDTKIKLDHQGDDNIIRDNQRQDAVNGNCKIDESNWREHMIVHLQRKGICTRHQSSLQTSTHDLHNNQSITTPDSVFITPNQSFPNQLSVAMTKLRQRYDTPHAQQFYEHSGGEESQRETPSGTSAHSSAASLNNADPPSYESSVRWRLGMTSAWQPAASVSQSPSHYSPSPPFPRTNPDGNSEWL